MTLYRQLKTVGLDRQNVYQVRDLTIDREDLHFSLNDGTIAFLEPVNGCITGALFAGQGEILLIPPNQVERQSLALFTKAAVLSEVFTVAYFRFSDDKFLDDLRPSLRPIEAGASAEFMRQYGSVAKSLAEGDALRTLIALTHQAQAHDDPKLAGGNFIRAHLSSARLRTFEVSFDTLSNEQISVSQASYTEKGRFYDQWTSFPMRSIREASSESSNALNKSSMAGNNPLESIVSINYSVRALVKPPTDLAAETTITLDVLRPGDRTLVFELSRYLKLSAVSLDGSSGSVPLEFIQNEAIEGSQLSRRGNDIVAVIFPQALAAGKIKLKFSYAGSVLADAGGGLLYVGARGIWYPNLGPTMSNFDLEFRYPQPWKLLATGKLVSKSSEADGQEVSRWRSEQPIPLAGFNLGKYVTASASSITELGNVVIDTYATRAMENTFTLQQRLPAITVAPSPRLPRLRQLPQPFNIPAVVTPDPTHNALSVAEQSAKTIDFLAPRIGRFPYTSLSLTQRPGPDSQGWPGLVFLSSYAFLSAQERMDQRHQSANDPSQILFASLMVAHETAHQWWGDAVFWQDYRSEWMIEALANYCALMQLEAEHPDQFTIMMDSYRAGLEKPDASASGRIVKEAGPVTLGFRLNSSQLPSAYQEVIYGRGTWLIHMLRHMFREAGGANPTASLRTGAAAKKSRRSLPAENSAASAKSSSSSSDPDAVFFSVLRGLQSKLQGHLISNNDLKRAFESALPYSLRFEGKQSLDWFFDGWVDGNAIPRYEIEDLKFSAAESKTIAHALLHQKDAPESLVTSIPIYAASATGQPVFVSRVFADGEETAITLTVPRGTRRLLIDPYHTVLTAK